MAAGPLTQVSDIITPEIFTPYIQQLTEEKARVVQSGIAARSPVGDSELAGGGVTFNMPSFQDLDSDADRVSTDTPYVGFTGGAADPDPRKINTSNEISVRLSRNNSWSSADLAAALAGEDPMEAIADRVAFYWSRRLQAATLATIAGVVADNTANDSGDYTNDVSNGGVFIDGVTNFSAEAFLDAAVTMGDSMDMLTGVLVHSVVFNRMQKNNLIDFIPDARGEISIPTFLGREVIVDDGMPAAANVYDTYLFGAGAIQLGMGSPKVGTEVERLPGAGSGGGQEVLYNRTEWNIHMVGHAFQGTPASGGPGNADLILAATWDRVYPERKQIKFARLVTTEA